jgi:hypothetical protein
MKGNGNLTSKNNISGENLNGFMEKFYNRFKADSNLYTKIIRGNKVTTVENVDLIFELDSGNVYRLVVSVRSLQRDMWNIEEFYVEHKLSNRRRWRSTPIYIGGMGSITFPKGEKEDAVIEELFRYLKTTISLYEESRNRILGCSGGWNNKV